MTQVPLLLAVVCCALFMSLIGFWINRKYSYWKHHNVPYVQPAPLVGNLKELLLFRTSFGDIFRQLYSHKKLQNAPIMGIYILHSPALMIRDPKLIEWMLVKNYDVFANRYEAANPLHDPLGSLSLPLAKFPIWRETRRRIAELYTSGMFKNTIYPKMLKIARNLEDYMKRQCEPQSSAHAATIEVQEMSALFTTDLTALVSFSIEANSLQIGDSDMRREVRQLLRPNWKKALHFFTIFFIPNLTGLLGARTFSTQYGEFMRRRLEETLERRKEDACDSEDLIDLLVKFQKECSGETHAYVHHPDFIVSQMAIFLLAGFETSSSLIAFTLYELAKQTQIQSQLRSEIKECLNQTQSISYETLKEMPYMKMVVSEALRLYPAATFINRECTPNVDAGFSLSPHLDFVIPKGMPAYVSILGLHRDPKYWKDPEHFNPERFSADALPKITPMTYIPFGVGPHSCVGSRLGLLQIKLGLVHILKDYKVEICAHTVPEIRFDPKAFMLHADKGIILKFIRDS